MGPEGMGWAEASEDERMSGIPFSRETKRSLLGAVRGGGVIPDFHLQFVKADSALFEELRQQALVAGNRAFLDQCGGTAGVGEAETKAQAKEARREGTSPKAPAQPARRYGNVPVNDRSKPSAGKRSRS